MASKTRWAWLFMISACSPPPPDHFAEAEALETQGKLVLAAEKFELFCAFSQDNARCDAAEARASAARIREAERAIDERRFADAERALLQALSTASESLQPAVSERLKREDLTLGLRYERALAGGNHAILLEACAMIAQTSVPIAAEARRFLEQERPKRQIEATLRACGPTHHGSCTRAQAELVAASPTSEAAREALALADAEARRIYPIRLRVEDHLQFFARQGKNQKALERCLNARLYETADQGQLHDTCEEEAFGKDTPEEVYRQRRNNEALFRRALASIADPDLVDALTRRKTQALAEGALARQNPPRPPPEPKRP